MIDRSVAYQLDGRPLGKRQLKKSKKRQLVVAEEIVLILDLILFLLGSTGSENMCVGEKKERKSSRPPTNLTF